MTKPKPSIVTDSLKSLSQAVRKHLQRLDVALHDPDLVKREKAVTRLTKTLELANDTAMIQGLGFSHAKVVQLKSANLLVKQKSELTKETSPHHDLIRFAEQKACGTLPHYARAAVDVKWLLDAGYNPAEVKDCWNDLEKEKWRGTINLASVRNNIGGWKSRQRPLLELVTEAPKTAAYYVEQIEKMLRVSSKADVGSRIAAIGDLAVRAQVNDWYQKREARTA